MVAFIYLDQLKRMGNCQKRYCKSGDSGAMNMNRTCARKASSYPNLSKFTEPASWKQHLRRTCGSLYCIILYLINLFHHICVQFHPNPLRTGSSPWTTEDPYISHVFPMSFLGAIHPDEGYWRLAPGTGGLACWRIAKKLLKSKRPNIWLFNHSLLQY